MATDNKKPTAGIKAGAKAGAKAGTKTGARAKSSPRLAQDIVIHNVEGEYTGAQSIAPDHSPRGPDSAGRLAFGRGLLQTGDMTAGRTGGKSANGRAGPSGADLKAQIEQLLFWQSELLDNKQWAQYIDLFTDDGVYWMPAAPEQTDWTREPSIFAEDKLMMEVRMGRVQHPTAWSQAPMWTTSHLIGNIVVESESATEVVVRSRFHMMELRRDQVRHFGGTYRHWLRKRGTGLQIRLQRVDLFNAQAPYDYVLQIWV